MEGILCLNWIVYVANSQFELTLIVYGGDGPRTDRVPRRAIATLYWWLRSPDRPRPRPEMKSLALCSTQTLPYSYTIAIPYVGYVATVSNVVFTLRFAKNNQYCNKCDTKNTLRICNEDPFWVQLVSVSWISWPTIEMRNTFARKWSNQQARWKKYYEVSREFKWQRNAIKNYFAIKIIISIKREITSGVQKRKLYHLPLTWFQTSLKK